MSVVDPTAYKSARLVSFQERLLEIGFTSDGPSLFRGNVTWTDAEDKEQQTEVVLTIPDSFPFGIPKVFPVSIPGPGWHLDPDGAMCLWSTGEETADLPWANPSTLVMRASAWLSACAQSWEGEPVDLDLERYLPSTPGLLLYEEEVLETAVGSGVRLRRVKIGAL